MDFKKGKGIVAQGRQNILNGYLLFHDEMTRKMVWKGNMIQSINQINLEKELMQISKSRLNKTAIRRYYYYELYNNGY